MSIRKHNKNSFKGENCKCERERWRATKAMSERARQLQKRRKRKRIREKFQQVERISCNWKEIVKQ